MEARLEGLEPPTRCLEGNWIGSLLDFASSRQDHGA